MAYTRHKLCIVWCSTFEVVSKMADHFNQGWCKFKGICNAQLWSQWCSNKNTYFFVMLKILTNLTLTHSHIIEIGTFLFQVAPFLSCFFFLSEKLLNICIPRALFKGVFSQSCIGSSWHPAHPHFGLSAFIFWAEESYLTLTLPCRALLRNLFFLKRIRYCDPSELI